MQGVGEDRLLEHCGTAPSLGVPGAKMYIHATPAAPPQQRHPSNSVSGSQMQGLPQHACKLVQQTSLKLIDAGSDKLIDAGYAKLVAAGSDKLIDAGHAKWGFRSARPPQVRHRGLDAGHTKIRGDLQCLQLHRLSEQTSQHPIQVCLLL